MATLKELKNRIKAIKSTKKITSAMKLIATARLKKSQIALNSARSYCAFYDEILSELCRSNLMREKFSAFFQDDASLPHLIIGLGSNKGLCGSYNYNILKEVQSVFDKKKLAGQQIYVVLLGKKLDTLAKSTPISNLSPYVIYEEKKRVDFTDEGNLSVLVNHIHDLLVQKMIGGVSIVTGHLRNLLQQPPMTYPMLPYEINFGHESKRIDMKEVIFEPDYKEFISVFLKQYINDRLMLSLRENMVCENASRMNAMENSSKNANEMIKSLEIEYNRGRQSVITKELIEIISGTNSV